MASGLEVQEALLKVWPESEYYKKWVEPYADEDDEDDGYEAEERVSWSYRFSEKMEWLEQTADEGVETSVGRVHFVKDSKRGEEGGGEEIFVVLRLVGSNGTEDQFFRAEGYYASWDGENWDDPDLVEVERIPYQAFRYERK